MALEFHKCCFCINLRTGCLIIGYLNLIGAIMMTVLTIVILVITVETVQSNYFYDSEYQQKLYEESKRIGAIIAPVIAALLVFIIHFLAFTIILIVGLHQHKRGLVKAYLIYALVIIVLVIIQFFASFTRPGINAGSIAMYLTFIFLNIYFLLVIRSYYQKMDDPANKPAIYNTA